MADRDVGGVKIRIGGDNSGFRNAVNDSKDALGGLGQSAQVTQAAFRGLTTVITGALAALSVGKVMQFADSWSEMRARISNAKGEMESTDAIMRRLNEVATRTYSSLNQTAESWLRNSTALKELGYTTNQQLDLTETLNNAMVVSATRGERAQRVMDAWSKAMATGKLQGDNLNSIIEGSDRLAKALADSLGVSTSQLRQMATDGKITTDVMFGVTSQLEQLRTEADNMPATLADASIAWEKAFQVIIGTTDTALGATQGLALMSVDLARAFEGQAETIATFFLATQTVIGNVTSAVSGALSAINTGVSGSEAAMIAAGGAAAYLATVMAGSLVGALGAVAGAIRAVTVAMMANPIGLLVVAAGAAITAMFLFRDQIKQAIGVDVVGVFKTAGNYIIQSFDLAFRNIRDIWSSMPAVLGDITISTANAVIAGIQSMINGAISLINDFTAGARGALGAIGLEVGDIGDVNLGAFENKWAGALGGIGDTLSQNLADTGAIDYLGELATGLDTVWQSAVDARAEIDGINGALGGDDGTQGGGGGGNNTGGGGGGSKAQKQAEQLALQLEQLRQSFMTEEELETAHYQKRLEELQMFYDKRMIAEGEYLSMIEQARVQHEEKLDSIRRASMEAEMQRYGQMGGYIKGTLESISQLMGSEGDKQIGIQKAISLAIAGINVAEGITKALTLPWPMNMLAVAQTAAQGIAAIASINQSSKGNPGSVGSIAASSGTNAPTEAPLGQAISIQGGISRASLYSGDAIYELIDRINSAQADGKRILITE